MVHRQACVCGGGTHTYIIKISCFKEEGSADLENTIDRGQARIMAFDGAVREDLCSKGA